MYSNNLVIAVKSNSQVLREQAGKVFIPYGTEYSIYLKNNHSASKALVTITVDGTNVMDGQLVIDPNTEITVERFVKNGNLSSGNKLKFIEKTAEISEFRGDKVEDGLIRITYQFEKTVYEKLLERAEEDRRHPWKKLPYEPFEPYTWTSNSTFSDAHESIQSKSILRSSMTKSKIGAAASSAAYTSSVNQLSTGTAQFAQLKLSTSTEGITVEGSKSNQQFRLAEAFEIKPEVFTIVLKLVGEIEHKRVEKPVLVKQTIQCKTCGQFNKTSHKFCSRCGTSVHMF